MESPLRLPRYHGLHLWLCVFTVVALAATAMAANVNGTVYTSTSDGTVVNANIFDSKADVYLNGGPQHENQHGIVPDGLYYFQVTDPSGAVLLSTDDILCRQIVVSGGRIVGVPSGPAPGVCSSYHAIGTPNPANGQTPVQLLPYNDTPNNGGEYKVWATPVVDYQASDCAQGHDVNGFCTDDSLTDNFKVRKPGTAAVTVCKFNDQNNSGTQDDGEPLLAHWPITATGVDTGSGGIGTVSTMTDDNGCATFTVSTFTNGSDTVTLTEGSVGVDWTQTAPPAGQCTLTGTLSGGESCNVSGATITLSVKPNDNANAPNFGNFNPFCETGCTADGLTVSKTADTSLKYTWGIVKNVDHTEIDTSNTSATFNYTVTVTNNGATGWQISGTIKVANPTTSDIAGINVADNLDNGSNGACTITSGGPNNDGQNMTILAGTHQDVSYVCTYSSAPTPSSGVNTATAAWDSSSSFNTASYDFGNPGTVIDGSVSVTDTLAGTLGTVAYTDPSPKSFMYPYTVNGTRGTCTAQNNTATFTTNTTGTTGNASDSVKVCVGADLLVSKTAAGGFNANLSKSANTTLIERGGSSTFTYTVTITLSAFNVSGTITVTNPNDWESVAVNLSDLLNISGATCTISGGSAQTVPASGSITPTYSCTWASGVPPATNGINTATATWNAAAYFTPSGSKSGTAGFSFIGPGGATFPLTVTDTFNNGSPTTLGTISLPIATKTYTYNRTVTPAAGTCHDYPNTVKIAQTGQTADLTVTACNTNTGALTMGFWKNTNGQGIIKRGTSTNNICNLGTWLRQLNPYQDLSATATCTQVATYVSNVIGAATCGGNTCNAMLRAQMLATALDVYFSTAGLGGNQIGAYNGLGGNTPPIGNIPINLSHMCSMVDGSSGATCTGSYGDTRPEFGIVSTGGCLGTTVGQMLAYADFFSTPNGMPVASSTNGSNWYRQIKNPRQVYAKDSFDNINNQIAPISPSIACSPSF